VVVISCVLSLLSCCRSDGYVVQLLPGSTRLTAKKSGADLFFPRSSGSPHWRSYSESALSRSRFCLILEFVFARFCKLLLTLSTLAMRVWKSPSHYSFLSFFLSIR
jgi:hypothetical protein